MASSFVLKRKQFDISAGGHEVSLLDLKKNYQSEVAKGKYTGSFKDYRTQQLGVKPEVVGHSTNAAGRTKAITQGGQAGAIDNAYNAAAQNRQATREANKALAAKNPNTFTTKKGQGMLQRQKAVQTNLDKKAAALTGGKASSVSGGVQTRMPNPKFKPKANASTLAGRWNRMGTLGKATTVAAGITAAGLIGKSLFGGKKTEDQ